jgi:hypothetical protein
MITIVQAALADKESDIMQTVADHWIEQGIEQGQKRILHDIILELIDVRFGRPSEELAEQITAVSNITLLRQLHREAATAFTLAAFTQKLAALTKEET